MTPDAAAAPFSRSVQALDPSAAAALVAEAEARTSALEGSLRAFVAARADRIAEIAAAGDDALAAQAPALGTAALEMTEVAEAAGLALLGSIASGIVAVVYNGGDKAWPAGLMRQHLEALAEAASPAGVAASDGKIMLARLRAARTKAGLGA